MKAMGCFGLALVFSTASALGGDLYYIDDAGKVLYKIDTDTMEQTTVGSTGVGSGDFGDLAYDPNSATMYWVAGRDNPQLYTIDLDTGAATLVGSHGVDDMFCLGYDAANGVLYAQSTNGGVYTLSTQNGQATKIGENQVYPGGYDYNADEDNLYFIEAGGGSIYTIDRDSGGANLVAEPGGINDCDITYDDDNQQYWAMDWSGFLYRFDAQWNRTTISDGHGSVGSVEYVGLGGACGDKAKLSVKCKSGGSKVVAKLKKGNPSVPVVFILDGDLRRPGQTNNKGKAKVKFTGLEQGRHEVQVCALVEACG